MKMNDWKFNKQKLLIQLKSFFKVVKVKGRESWTSFLKGSSVKVHSCKLFESSRKMEKEQSEWRNF